MAPAESCVEHWTVMGLAGLYGGFEERKELSIAKVGPTILNEAPGKVLLKIVLDLAAGVVDGFSVFFESDRNTSRGILNQVLEMKFEKVTQKAPSLL